MARILSAELAGRRPCLEVGVGTGRIALPLARAGVEMVGVDLSRPMLDQLVQKAGGLPFPLAVGDARALPFGDGSFGAGLVAHVLHLIPTWRRAVEEMARVLRPGGVLLVALGRREPQLQQIESRFMAEAGVTRPFVGLDHDPVELDRVLETFGARMHELPAIEVAREIAPATFIDELGEGCYSWTWQVSEPVRRRAAERVRDWAAGSLGSLDQPRRVGAPMEWRAYDLP
jgi:SAM-dependent methyltransferase